MTYLALASYSGHGLCAIASFAIFHMLLARFSHEVKNEWLINFWNWVVVLVVVVVFVDLENLELHKEEGMRMNSGNHLKEASRFSHNVLCSLQFFSFKQVLNSPTRVNSLFFLAT